MNDEQRARSVQQLIMSKIRLEKALAAAINEHVAAFSNLSGLKVESIHVDLPRYTIQEFGRSGATIISPGVQVEVDINLSFN